jgi:SAM-dependent methyltransferase
MTAEFTGERVIPGQVDVDLWNEHISRYAFASRFSDGKNVLDAGCGTGYGAAELAGSAASVTGIDIAADAVELARSRYSGANLRWSCGSCADLPFAADSFDLVVAFEVIEHLRQWPKLVSEARRVLSSGGCFIVSTPNKSFYADTRRESGPNPFHEHEFEFEEFRDALQQVFPHVSIALQDHVEAIAFRFTTGSGAADLRLGDTNAPPSNSGFFIAICSIEQPVIAPDFVYVPNAANALREKIVHIGRLEQEVATKNGWLADQQTAHQQLLSEFRAQNSELQQSNEWAASLDAQLTEAGERIRSLQEQLEERAQWVENLKRDLQQQSDELVQCVELLHQAEATVEERTKWALDLDAALSAVQASRWVRMGRAVGLGPELPKA